MFRGASLLTLVLVYLSIPVLIFLVGWFNVPVAFVGIVAWGLWVHSLRPILKPDRSHLGASIRPHIKAQTVALCVLLAVIWAYLAGVGDFRPQHFDYYKHNLIFNNLVRLQWPICYADGQYLCYYLAYYLPAAALSKLYGGLAMAHWYSFVWTSLGLALLFVQLHRLGGWWFVVWFMLFNSPESMLIVYEAIKSPHTLAYTLSDLWTNDHTIELIFTPGGLVFPSHVESITAVPQHSLAAWLILALFIENPRRFSISLFFGLCVLLLYWSPLVAVGMVPLVAVSGVYYLKNQSKFTIYQVWPIGVFAIPVVVYYGGHVPMVDASGWWWEFLNQPHQWVLLVLFVTIEIGIWSILLLILNHKSKIFLENKMLIYSALGSLLVLALYRYGHFNDLARRASLPATFVLCWYVWQCLLAWKKHKTYQQVALAVVVVFAIALPIKHHLKWLTPRPYMAQVNVTIASVGTDTIHDLEKRHLGEFDVVAQYLGQSKSWYSQYFAPKKHTDKK
jgi:hypothetical protein